MKRSRPDLLRPPNAPDTPSAFPTLDRRDLLMAAPATAFLLGASALQAQTQNPPEAVKPRVVVLRAVAVAAKLGLKDGPDSILFRLHDSSIPIQQIEAGLVPPTPVFRARFGETLEFRIENGLESAIALHLRGLRQPNARDGVPGLTGTPIAPGASATLEITTRQPGTFILTPSLAGAMPEQNARGLHAVLIVEEPSPQVVDHDLALSVSDIRLDERGAILPDFLQLRDLGRVGRLGNRLTANGRPAPDRMAVRPGARIRLRLVNVSNARVLPLRVTNLRAEVIAIDSTPCMPFDPLKRTVVLSPGSRIEMIVDAPEKAGEDGLVEARIGNGIPIFAFRTEGEPLAVKPKFQPLPDPGLPPAIRLQDATRAELIISGGLGREDSVEDAAELKRRFPDVARVFSVNGAPGGFAGKPVATVARGKVLVLALINRSAWPQVLAVHGHAFRLLHPYDDGWEPYFLDTLYLTSGTTARIALIANNPGKWAIRSMVAEHYAAGVSTWFQVN